jgi:hypothetical protein
MLWASGEVRHLWHCRNDHRRSAHKQIPRDGGYWDETTSFILVESNLNTPAMAKHVSKGLSAKDDMLVVFDPSDMSCAYFGAVMHPDVLKSFFSNTGVAAA